MKVFIENEAGSNKKNLFDEKTLEYRKTVEVSRKYPYPYGFVLETTSGDGDNLDCFILTTKVLKTGDIIDAEPVGMFEQIEDGKEDNKILAIINDESFSISEEVKKVFKDFTENVFLHKPGKTISIGKFLGKEEANKLLEKCKDKHD